METFEDWLPALPPLCHQLTEFLTGKGSSPASMPPPAEGSTPSVLRHARLRASQSEAAKILADL